MLFNKVAILGVGLIGSSVARNIMEKKLASELYIFDKNVNHLEDAKKLGIGTCFTSDIKVAVENVELVIFATPVCSLGELAKECQKYAKSGTVFTDVGSVKGYALEEIEKYLNKDNGFVVVGGHPVAGTEKSGPLAGFSLLFKDRWCILTPDDNSTKEAVEKITKLWECCEMKVELMDASHHDKVMAAVSHLPQLIAYSIVGTVDDLEDYEHKEIIKYSAGGFRDFTRIAGSDPTMWRDIFLTNKKPVLELIQRFIEDLVALERNIRWDEGDKLFSLFTRTQKIRKDVIEAKQHQPEAEKVLEVKGLANK